MSLRRSTRLKHQPIQALSIPAVQFEDENYDFLEDPDEDVHEDKAPRKRRKKKVAAGSTALASSASKTRRGGKLRNLPEMPLDILFDIFGHLQPYDLLRLSRATKALRRILLKRSSSFLWKSALENISGLPSCPPQLSEPAYVNLAFDTHCHLCGAQGAKTIFWSLFKRVCRSCEKTEMSRLYDYNTHLNDCISELGIFDEQLNGFKQDYVPMYYHTYFLCDLVDSLRVYAAIESIEDKEAWGKRREIEINQRWEFEKQASLWLDNWRTGHAEEIAEMKMQRRNAILDRMKAEGWADVVEKMNGSECHEFEEHKVVKQSRDLTDRVWKNIKPTIIGLFTGYRNAQRERDMATVRRRRIAAFRSAFEAYCSTLPYDSIIAPLAQVLMIDTIQALIHDERLDFFPDNADFDAIFSSRIPEVTEKWKEGLDQYLCRLIWESREAGAAQDTGGTVTTDHLGLATSVFTCEICNNRALSYIQVLTHMHRYPRFRRHVAPKYSNRIIECFSALEVWPIEKTSFSLVRPKLVNLILQACDLPVDTTTWDELDRLNPVLECLLPSGWCYSFSVKGRHALPWISFLLHNRNFTTSDFRVLKDEELSDYTYRCPSLGPEDDTRIFACKHCYTPDAMSFEKLQDHLSSRHRIEITSKESAEDYIIHPAFGNRYSGTGIGVYWL